MDGSRELLGLPAVVCPQHFCAGSNPLVRHARRRLADPVGHPRVLDPTPAAGRPPPRRVQAPLPDQRPHRAILRAKPAVSMLSTTTPASPPAASAGLRRRNGLA